MDTSGAPFDQLQFDNRFTHGLPADRDLDPRPRQVHGAAFSRVQPTASSAPSMLAWSREVAASLGIDDDAMRSQDAADVLGGNRVPLGAEPFAACYGGHQFGTWAGQLGDGRALALGEVIDARGEHQTLQLKGAGSTPYSRSADGRAVLRSSVREFLCSEAMHHLGIPTTRALSLVLTGDEVVRDVMYDGHPAPEPGAVVCRVAPSFLRFGSFELPAMRGDVDLLRMLASHAITTHAPELLREHGTVDDAIAPWFAQICDRTCSMVVEWMRVGFVHGVLNTDNMSTLGLTIDYGPYGWLEPYEPGWTPNTTDAEQRRYRFGNQPQVAHWNLIQLASALVPIVGDVSTLEGPLRAWQSTYEVRLASMMSRRLGWGELEDGDERVHAEWLDLLERASADYVLVHRELSSVQLDPERALSDAALSEPLRRVCYEPEHVDDQTWIDLAAWLRRWSERVIARGGDTWRTEMDACNPRFVLRNYLAHEAIEAAHNGDLSLVEDLQDTLRRPYEEQPGRGRLATLRPDWARDRVGTSMLSCSS